MDAEEKRRVITEMLEKLKADMLTAIEKMPHGWEEMELQWFLARRAELFYVFSPADRPRRIAYNNALRTRGL